MEIIEQLSERLRLPLPGSVAQQKMAAYSGHNDFSAYQPNDKTREGGVLMLLYPHQNELYFPLIVRPSTEKGVHSGQVAFPGGKREMEDENLVITALREGYEEVGIDPSKIEIIGQLSPLYIFASNFMVQPTIAFTSQKPQFVPSELEVAEILEVKLQDLINPNRKKVTQITVANGLHLQAPYFDMNGQIVWGATAMMLSEFVEIWKELS